MTPTELEKRAEELFKLNARGYRNAPAWDELHEQTRQLWRAEAKKRPSNAPSTTAKHSAGDASGSQK